MITELAIWHRADADVSSASGTASDGELVTEWDNVGGTLDVTQSDTGRQPTFLSDPGLFNFNPAVDFVSGDELRSTASPFPSYTENFTSFAVVFPENGPGSGHEWHAFNNSTDNDADEPGFGIRSDAPGVEHATAVFNSGAITIRDKSSIVAFRAVQGSPDQTNAFVNGLIDNLNGGSAGTALTNNLTTGTAYYTVSLKTTPTMARWRKSYLHLGSLRYR